MAKRFNAFAALNQEPRKVSLEEVAPAPNKVGSNFRFRKYQIEDLARAAMHDGAIVGWDPGLGKTAAAFAWPILKGARRVLIVAPGGLHAQIVKEGREKFGIDVRPLMSQADFYNDALLRPNVVIDSTWPVYWITTYEALGRNGADEWPIRYDENGDQIRNMPRETARYAHPAFREALKANVRQLTETFTVQSGAPEAVLEKIAALQRLADDPAAYQGEIENALQFISNLREKYQVTVETRTETRTVELSNPLRWFDSIGGTVQGITCVYTPTLARLVADVFDCVAVDEGVRLKATDSLISQGIRALRPKFRLVLSGTPIKNLLIDLFWLAHWICGGHDLATARWPYENSDDARERFADEHMLQERNVTREEESKKRSGKRGRYVKRTAQICNIHRLWKLLGPVVIRRRKDDCGEELVAKTIVPIRVRPGSAQQKVYTRYLLNKPVAAKGTPAPTNLIEAASYGLHGGAAIGIQLQLLREAALCPDSPHLAEAVLKPEADKYPRKSWTDLNPKSAAILSLVADLLVKGECVTVISPFQHFNATLTRRLREAGVKVALCDGTVAAKKRGALAAEFKEGKYSVLVGGTESMSEGHDFAHCAHLVLPSLTWAMDKNAQAIERVHRLTSKRPVTIYAMVTENTVDVRLESLFNEKRDSSNLALDGRLFADRTEEINLAQLLAEAIDNFDPSAPTLDEQSMETQWESELRERLRHAQATFDDPTTPPMRKTTTLALDHGRDEPLARPQASEPLALHFSLPHEDRDRLELPADLFAAPAQQYALL